MEGLPFASGLNKSAVTKQRVSRECEGFLTVYHIGGTYGTHLVMCGSPSQSIKFYYFGSVSIKFYNKITGGGRTL